MPDPTLIQQQRQLLRTFRNATQTRSQDEQTAKTRYQNEKSSAETAFQQAQGRRKPP